MSKSGFCNFCNGNCLYAFSKNSNSQDFHYIASHVTKKLQELLFRRSNLDTAMLEEMVLSRSGISDEFLHMLWAVILSMDVTAADRAVFLDRLKDVFHFQHGGDTIVDLDDSDREEFPLYNLMIVDESEVVGDDASAEDDDDDDSNDLSDPNDYSDEDYL